MIRSKVNGSSAIVLLYLTFLFANISQDIGVILNITLPLGARHVVLLLGISSAFLSLGSLKFRLDRKYSLIIALNLIIIVLNYFFINVPLRQYIFGVLLTFIFILVSSISYNIQISRDKVEKLIAYIIWSILILFGHAIIGSMISGLSLRWESGLFRESGAMASMLNIALLLSLYLYKKNSNILYIFLAAILTFSVIAITIKKAIFALALLWVIYIIMLKSNKERSKIFLSILVIFILVGSFYFSDLKNNIDENSYYLNRVGYEQHVRYGMYIASYQIMWDHFPLGSGYGSFGSLASIAGWYSPLYAQYGVSRIGSNRYEDVARGSHTLLDTFWPHIIAEGGLIGLILYIAIFSYPAIFSFYRYPKQNRKAMDNSELFYVIGILMLMINDGLSLYNPEIPVFIFFHSSLVWIIIRQRKLDEPKFLH